MTIQGSARILAVDDNEDALFALEKLLKEQGFDVLTAADGRQALQSIKDNRPDIVLLDVVMPGLDGYEVTRRVKADPELRYVTIVLLTSKDELDDVIFGLEQGADDYIKKPFKKEELLARINAVLRTKNLYQELKSVTKAKENLQAKVEQRFSYQNIIGQNAALRSVFDVLDKVKDSDLPVLISGESGTGKELIACALHYASRRCANSFVIQNCSSFNENILESELFGHVKGAFSGALRDKEGLFEVADHGTFFLDELGEMSLALQARLLRVLENGSFMPVGSTKERKVDVRIVAATNRDLQKMVKEGKFREDLYYRLNVINIKLPALRERRDDIPALIEHFLSSAAKRDSKPKKQLSQESLKSLCDYAWPGNIRELKNELERLILLSGSAEEIPKELLSPHILKSPAGLNLETTAGTLGAATEHLERCMILAALERLNWNKSEAARELGVSRSSLIAKVQQYGLEKQSE